MGIADWPGRWEAIRIACKRRGATGRWDSGRDGPPRVEIAPPADLAEVESVEKAIGRGIPASFRKVLLGYSRAVAVEWEVSKEIGATLPDVLREIWAGECRWNLEDLVSLDATYRECLGIFSNPDDWFDVPWQDKFPVLEVGNGDMIVIDVRSDDEQPVVYLSHEGDDTIHGFWLGRDYEDYIDRLTLLGCVGAEDWQLAPFVSGPRSCLETASENARLWREWIGLHFDTEGYQD